ncbi:MAG TPA: type II toxin-antitoxin system HicB family antitoxin [Dehalococcoidia bacterium]|nr:type II toxin-antitoxin system HicB family antitoxin [Dehalococcoidia bacterium]
MSSYDYLIIIHPDEDGGFWTEVPALPGCGSQGESVEDAVEMTKDAIQGFIESMKKHGEAPPTERTLAIKVTVAA